MTDDLDPIDDFLEEMVVREDTRRDLLKTIDEAEEAVVFIKRGSGFRTGFMAISPSIVNHIACELLRLQELARDIGQAMEAGTIEYENEDQDDDDD